MGLWTFHCTFLNSAWWFLHLWLSKAKLSHVGHHAEVNHLRSVKVSGVVPTSTAMPVKENCTFWTPPSNSKTPPSTHSCCVVSGRGKEEMRTRVKKCTQSPTDIETAERKTDFVCFQASALIYSMTKLKALKRHTNNSVVIHVFLQLTVYLYMHFYYFFLFLLLSPWVPQTSRD